ncbi:unnamed protein product [Sphagnum balticum]
MVLRMSFEPFVRHCKSRLPRKELEYIRRIKVKGVSHHFKCGNMNNGLKQSNAEYAVMMDADMILQSSFLRRTLPHIVMRQMWHLCRNHNHSTIYPLAIRCMTLACWDTTGCYFIGTVWGPPPVWVQAHSSGVSAWTQLAVSSHNLSRKTR